MKKILLLFLALVASVGIINASVTIDGIAYNLNSSALTAEVTSGGNYSGEVVIPSSVIYNEQTYSVTSIGSYAFYGCTGLTSVTIPNSVASIGNNAFSVCTGLTSPVYNANCFGYMPKSYSGAYTIPDGIKQVAGSAFSGCAKLTSITIPNSVISIGDSAFSRCTGLTSVTVPNSVTSIGWSAFEYVPNVIYKGNANGSPWGAKCINGGDSANLWRSLTEKEWKYILMSRPHASERFSLGTVNGVKGLILLPDYWELPAGLSFNVPNMTAEGQDYYREYGKNIDHFIDNTYTAAQWQAMETNGAVFLPVTGYRLGTEVTLEDICYYWTSGVPESTENLYAYRVRAFSKWIQGAQGTQRIFGCAVRLARDL